MGNLDLERMAEELGLGVLCCRNDGALTIVYASDSFYRSLGYEPGEIKGLLPPGGCRPVLSGAPVDWNEVAREIREKGNAQPELRLLKKNGHHIWVSFLAEQTETEDGSVCFCGLVRDITQQRRSLRVAREQREELEALTRNVPGGVLRAKNDEFLTLSLVSEGFSRITGYSRAEIETVFQNRFLNLVYEDDRALLMREIGIAVRTDSVTEITYRIVGRHGRLIWVLDKARRQTDCNGNTWLYSVLIDVTEIKKAQDDLALSEERYRVILEKAADPVFDCDLRTKNYYVSPAFRRKFGPAPPPQEDVLRSFVESGIVCPADCARMYRDFCAFREKHSAHDAEYRFRDLEKGYIWCNVHIVFFYDRQGAPKRMVAVITDIDKRKREAIYLRKQAEHDLLTGLYNQVTTADRINGVLLSSAEGDRHALFVMDIDNFKDVNDHLGHRKGDELIVRTAGRLRGQFRGEDIIGRVGGDEFVILLKRISSVDLVVRKAELLRLTFREEEKGEGGAIGVSGSIGIAFYPNDGKNYDELFRKADTAMYAAKKSGKDSYRIYVPGIEKIADIGADGSES